MDNQEDGWRVIPPLRKSPVKTKGIKCGQCGMKFEDGKAYGYCCMNQDCPIFVRAT